MRRRSFQLLVAVTVAGCGGAPEPAPQAEPDEPVERADSPAVVSDTILTVDPADTSALRAGVAPVDTADVDGPWNEARARGVDFRAIGQEPGWFLEIDEGRTILFAYDYGTERISVPAPDPYRDDGAGRTTYRVVSGDRELVVIIETESCFDTMSGEAFDRTVTVNLGAREYRGCGRVL